MSPTITGRSQCLERTVQWRTYGLPTLTGIQENKKEGETIADTERIQNFYVHMEPIFFYLPIQHT